MDNYIVIMGDVLKLFLYLENVSVSFLSIDLFAKIEDDSFST